METKTIVFKKCEIDEISIFSTIYCRGFSDKMPYVFKNIPEEKYVKLMTDLFKDMLCNSRFPGLYVAKYDGKIGGVIHLSYRGSHKNIMFRHMRNFQKELGWFKGLRSILMLYTFDILPRGNSLHIDGIVTDSEYRGKNIGTTMLNNTFQIAKELRFGSIFLEVIDRNPEAKKLYERLGFVSEKKKNVPFPKIFMGVKYYFVMRKKI